MNTITMGKLTDYDRKKLSYVEIEMGKKLSSGAQKTMAQLIRHAWGKGADEVFLATDPDREGEAIAWHLEDALKLKGAQRVTYTEITESAVKAALAKPRKTDMDLVAAQEGRRVLDRFVGYLVSPALSSQTGQRLSAGRVQSPAVRLIVDREREIKAFRVTVHYGVELVFDAVEHITDGWKALPLFLLFSCLPEMNPIFFTIMRKSRSDEEMSFMREYCQKQPETKKPFCIMFGVVKSTFSWNYRM